MYDFIYMKRMVASILLVLSFITNAAHFTSEGFSIYPIIEKAEAAVKVKGYYRKDGTYVRPHYRSNPDGNPYNNWSFPGNTNPYTGETATGDPSTYLKNNGADKSSSDYLPTIFWPTVTPSFDLKKKCGINTYEYDGGCYCVVGFELNSLQQCAASDAAATFERCEKGTCYCPKGKVIENGKCVSSSLGSDDLSSRATVFIKESKSRLLEFMNDNGNCFDIKSVWIDGAVNLKESLKVLTQTEDVRKAMALYRRYISFLHSKYISCEAKYH